MSPPGQPAFDHIDRALPHDHGDRAEDQRDDHGGQAGAQRDAPLGRSECRFDRFAEARRFALFLAERLNDLHRDEHFGGSRADIGDAILAGAGHLLKPPPDEHDRQHDHRNAEQQHARELGGEREQIGDAADADDQVAQRDRHGGADDLFDDRGIRCHARCDFGWAVGLEKAGSEPQQIALHRQPDVGHHALAEPRYEIETQCGGKAQHHGDQEQVAEPATDVFGAAASIESTIDHQLEACRNRKRCACSDRQAQAVQTRFHADRPKQSA